MADKLVVQISPERRLTLTPLRNGEVEVEAFETDYSYDQTATVVLSRVEVAAVVEWLKGQM